MSASKSSIKKAVLAYSGGLDTSVILKWLEDTYGCEIVTFTADIGQGEEVEPARAKAEAMGVKNSCVTMCFRCFVPIPFMKVNTCWVHRSHAR
jgi:argininosuccinate synthase